MRIAIVGAGVSGLVAAHLLHREHEIVVYEAGAYAGGHANTVRVDTPLGSHHVDTGFIVMNDRNYPNFTRLLDRLGVARQPTHMSFSIKGEDEDFEYAGTPRGLFCQPRNLLSARFHRMLVDMLRFNRELRAMLAHDRTTDESLGDFLSRRGFSRAFVERLIVPQVSAVWSADPRQLRSLPVRFMAEFFANHGMLGFRDRPRWSTVAGGSARYVDALIAPFRERIRLNTPVRSIARREDHVEIASDGDGGIAAERYDQVVIATHADQALALLRDPSPRELALLGAIPYQGNEAVLHTDSAMLPRRRAARAAWNFHLLREPKPLSTVTYYMNHLQRLRADRDFCVTLNRSEAIDPAHVIRTISYAHPVYTPAGVAAQSQHASISGLARRTHFCGAYWGWGFHEDGVVSALRACEPFGVTL
ncbi:MAG TPA: FAD-dependent oxidoreductase [Solirubrobacteraceae bacterium]|jgi:predicted NAD/FAD-binding protein|nr:FAD-dependent oxidoreductase [Solirubrobacteraceae bacterium]